jgi:hypothetical protein
VAKLAGVVLDLTHSEAQALEAALGAQSEDGYKNLGLDADQIAAMMSIYRALVEALE